MCIWHAADVLAVQQLRQLSGVLENSITASVRGPFVTRCGRKREPAHHHERRPIAELAQPRHVRANESLQGINFCRSASATAWVLLRAPSLVCAFFR